MNLRNIYTVLIGTLLSAGGVLAQDPGGPPPGQGGTAPIYRITVVQRTTKAINYRYRSDPTPIDFGGTVLMPKAKGTAMVTSKQGRTEIDANFQNLTPPTPLGQELLTYVLWALTPDGRPHNLGEIIANSQNKAGIHVTTDLQAFALIVTAEPYSSIRRPSDVVVLENQVRPDTIGMIEQVNAKYELLPRGHYTLQLSNPNDMRPPESARVSTREYEVLLELYQAQNAINIARAARADVAAGDVLARAEAMLRDARAIHDRKGERTIILQRAREATQTAEDARLVAEERFRKEDSNNLKAQVAMNRQAQATAEAEATQARVDKQAAEERLQRAQAELQHTQERAQAQLEAERAARLQAEAQVATMQQQQASGAQAKAAELTAKRQTAEQKAYRVRVLESLNTSALPAIDTPRGLVVTLNDACFGGTHLRADALERARRLATTLAGYRGLTVGVEGYSDSSATERESRERAEEIASLLRANGIQAQTMSMGNRPIGPTHTENNRVEIVVSGDALGHMASWDHPYAVSLENQR